MIRGRHGSPALYRVTLSFTTLRRFIPAHRSTDMSLNRVMVIGNLGANPELRYLQSGRAVANLSVATSDFYADPQGQKRHTAVEWHRVVVFGKLAESCHQYLQK